jgi:hypothetical protein
MAEFLSGALFLREVYITLVLQRENLYLPHYSNEDAAWRNEEIRKQSMRSMAVIWLRHSCLLAAPAGV